MLFLEQQIKYFNFSACKKFSGGVVEGMGEDMPVGANGM